MIFPYSFWTNDSRANRNGNPFPGYRHYVVNTNNLIAYYTLNDTNIAVLAVDSWVNGLNLTTEGTVSSIAGKVGNAAFFEQVDTPRLTINHNIFNFTSSFTLILWAFHPGPNTVNADTTLISCSGGYTLSYNASLNTVTLTLVSTTTPVSLTVSSNLTNIWRFIVCGYDSASDSLFLQIDDGAINTVSFAGRTILFPSNQFWIGSYASAISVNQRTIIDEVYAFRETLNLAGRTRLYNGGAGRPLF